MCTLPVHANLLVSLGWLLCGSPDVLHLPAAPHIPPAADACTFLAHPDTHPGVHLGGMAVWMSLRPQQCHGEQLLSHSLADHTKPMSGSQCGLKGTQQGIREMCAGTRRIRKVGRDATVEGGVGRECNSRAPLPTSSWDRDHQIFLLALPTLCTEHNEKCNPSPAHCSSEGDTDGTGEQPAHQPAAGFWEMQ